MRRLALALCLVTGVAHAGVGVVTAGEPTAQAPTAELVKAWLHEHAFEVDESFAGDARATLINCFAIEDLPCARGVFEARSASTNLVHVRVDLEPGKGPNYMLTTYWFVKGHDPTVDKRRCTSCDAAALAKAVDGLMATLAGASAINKGRVKITARSQGVIVWIDDVKHGVAPLERDLDPGKHELKFTAQGRTLRTQHVTIDPGRAVEVASPELESRPFPWVPASLVGGGIAAGVVGGVFLYYGSLDGPDERYVYDNATKIGVPITLVGGVAIIAGGVLWFRGHHRAAPAVTAGANTVQLHWTGVF